MAKKSKKSQYRASSPPCAYCGKPSSTRDHVIPRGIFVGLDQNMITVRACFDCNQKKASFDTFLRDFLAVDMRAHEHHAAQHNFAGPFARAAMRGQSELAKRIVLDSRPAEIVTPAGLIVWQGSSLDLSDGEIDEALKFVVRGLTYHHLKQRVSHDAVIEVLLLTPDGAEIAWNSMQKTGGITGPIALGDEVFRWAFQYANADASVWLIAFYGRLYFLVGVQPPGSTPLFKK